LSGYDGREFLGLKQLKQTTYTSEVKGEKEELSTKGLNAYVRHPMYFATLLVIWGMFVIIPNNYVLITAVITTLYLLPGIYLEEQKLIVEFGQSYKEYKKNVPMLLPKFRIISELWKT
jgi:protein-S-isoprenylcysteine O-methyltransferase Ste14